MGIGRAIRPAADAEHTRMLGWTGQPGGGMGIGTLPLDQGGPFGNSLENLYASPILDGWSPQTAEGDSLLWTYSGALSIPGVARAAALHAAIVGSLPFDAYTDHGRDDLEILDPRPPLLEQPAPPDTRITTLSSWVLDYLFHGNAMAVIASRDSLGRPTAIYPVPAPWCWVRRVIDNEIVPYTPIPAGVVEYSICGEPYAAEDVIHIKALCAPGALRGFGVLEQHLRGTLATAHLQARESQNMSRHGVPPGYLRVTNDSAEANDPDAMRAVKTQWMRDRDLGGVAVLNNAVDFTPIAWTPDNMQMVQARQLNLLDVANIMGVPPSKIGAQSGNSYNYTNNESDSIEMLRFSTGAILTRFEQALTLLFPRGTIVKADLDTFLRADTLTRYQSYSLALMDGWIKRSEVRAKEHMPVIPHIDDEAPTDAVQLKLNKLAPVTTPAIMQAKDMDPSASQVGATYSPTGQKLSPNAAAALPLPTGGPGAPPASASVHALAQRLDQIGVVHERAVSELMFKPGTPLFLYWTTGKGTARYMDKPHPWTALRDALVSEGVDPGQANGLATNLMMATPEGRALFKLHHQGKDGG